MRFITITVEVDSVKGKGKFVPSPTTRLSDDGKITYWQYSGECIHAEPGDFESQQATDRLNAELVKRLGKVERGKAKGAERDIAWCLNNGGLRLIFGDEIKSSNAIASANDVEIGQAIAWAATNLPATVARLGTDYKAAIALIVEAYRKAVEDINK